MKPELTKQDLEILFEAVSVWENDTGGCNLPHVQAIFADDGGSEMDMEERITKKLDKAKADYEAAWKMKKQRSVLLRAKLIAMGDQKDIDELCGEGK